jgi:aqualysin 1
MQRTFVSLALAAAAAFVLGVPAQAASDRAARADSYIVVLKRAVDPGAVAALHSQRYHAAVEFVYTHALPGYAAVIPNERVAQLRADENVDYVELDGEMTALAQTLPSGIDTIDADVSSTRAGDGAGDVGNVNAYIIDTGIDTSHADLNVVGHVNFASGPNRDCNGHGTHVAGTVAAKDNAIDVVGVAPGAPLTGVKVLGCNGSGSTSRVIKGIDWVTANSSEPAIANMSLGGGASAALDTAVRNSVASGVFYAVAAGNDGASACTESPARAGTTNGIVTVAATDAADAEASWSNYGGCVDLWAPGVGVLSTRNGGGTTTYSGTSMASPHVGGGGALYLSTNAAATPADVEFALKRDAVTPGTRSKDGRAITRLYVGRY